MENAVGREYPANSWMLFKEPRPVKIDKDLQSQLFLELVKQGEERDWNRELSLSDAIYERYLKGLPYHEAFQKTLGMLFTLDNILAPAKKHSFGGSDLRRKNYSSSSIAVNLIASVTSEHAETVPDDYIKKLREQIVKLKESERPFDKIYFTNLQTLGSELENSKRTCFWIDQLKKNLLFAKEKLDVEEIRQLSQKVWEQTQDNQGYGVKTCYFTSPLFAPLWGMGYFIDPTLGISDEIIKGIYVPNIFAGIGIGTKPKQEPRFKGEIEQATKGFRLVSIEPPPEIRVLFAIDNNGEIRESHVCYIPLRRIFEKKDAISEFELWRLFAIMRLYDLTKRADLVEKLPSIDEFEKKVLKERQGWFLGLGKKKKIDYKVLVLPRTKSIEPENTTSEKQKVFRDKHHVVWHIRRLPEGYHATQRAREYAMEHGITLDNNETIVREHWRGSRPEKEPSHPPTKARFKS